MPTVGEQLRAGREAQKMTVNQVAEITKIRTDHIRELEAGNYDLFVAPVYIRGFVRACARLLKLDVPGIMATLDTELGRTEKFRDPPPLTSPSGGALDYIMLQLSRVNWRMSLAALAVLGVIGLGAGLLAMRRNMAKADPSAGLPPALYQSASESGESLSLTNGPARR